LTFAKIYHLLPPNVDPDLGGKGTPDPNSEHGLEPSKSKPRVYIYIGPSLPQENTSADIIWEEKF
jgi:hypothetical protein